MFYEHFVRFFAIRTYIVLVFCEKKHIFGKNLKNSMEKKIFYPLFAAVVLLFAESALAEQIDAQQARQQAMAFLNRNATTKKMLKGGNADLQLAYTAQSGEYYAFNASAADGYVLVSGDGRMPAVIGYSDEGKFDADAIPDNMREWLETYAEQVRYVQTHAGVRIQSSTDQTSIGNVYPLLGSTKWNQSAPYNNMCPTFSNNGTTQRTVTGCVATAMAQVMYYHRWPETGTGSNTYTFNLNSDEQQPLTLSADFNQSRYDWANMLPSYTGNETTTQNNAVAKLMSDCGVAMDMGYGASSGAVTRIAMNRMPKHFRYDKSIKFIMRDAYTLDKWLSIINGELSSNRPVIHTGASNQGGHAFVVDGCNSNGYYHVNWGWNGTSNGYFVLTDLTPTDQGIGSSEGGYNLRQGLIYNIMPDRGGAVSIASTINEFITNSDKVALGSTASLRWNNFYVMWTGDGDAAARLALGLTDEAGDVLQVPVFKDLSGFDPKYNYGYSFSMPVPSNLAAGTYYVVPLIAPVQTTNYQKVDVSRATAQRIKMEVKDGYANFSYPDDDATLQVTKLEYSDVLAADRPILVKATIRNTGEEFVDNLCVALLNSNGAIVGKSVPKNVDVQNGAEVVLETTVTTLSTGNFKLAVLRVADYSVVSGVQESVTIGATPADINMSIVSPLKLIGSVIPTTHLEGTTTISNNGGAFAGRLEAFILAEGSNSVLSRVFSEFVTIKKGEKKEVKFDNTFTRGEVGQTYRIVLRDPHKPSGNYVWGNFFNFTLGAPVRGDVNLDGVADVSDVTALINYVLGGGGSPFDKTEADFNGDSVIDVTDATALINLVLN